MRRLTRWGSATVALAFIAGAAMVIDRDASPDVVAAGDQPTRASTASGLFQAIERIKITMGAEATNEVVIQFRRRLPDDTVRYVRDMDDFDATGIAYTTQEYTSEKPTPLWTCGNKHFGFSPPAVVGQVDILLPARWFGDAPPVLHEIPTDVDGAWTPKTVLCAPRGGGIQYAIWSPSSHNPRDIRVHVEGASRLVIETYPRS